MIPIVIDLPPVPAYHARSFKDELGPTIMRTGDIHPLEHYLFAGEDGNYFFELGPKVMRTGDIHPAQPYLSEAIKATFGEDGNYFFEKISVNTKEQSTINSFEQKIFNKLSFPESWVKEGIVKPNLAAKQKAFNVCRTLFEKYDLVPDRIVPTKEEGIFIAYDQVAYGSDRSLMIEIYNNLNTAAIVCDNLNKTIINAEDIYDLDFFNVIKKFKATNT